MRTSGLYVTGDINIRTQIRSFQKTLVIRQVNEVADYIKEDDTVIEGELAPARYIAFNNGILDLEADTLQLQEFTPDIVLTHKLNVDFVAPADVPYNEDDIAFVDNFFNSITKGDTELITFLYELIGYCCYRGCDYHSIYLFSARWWEW